MKRTLLSLLLSVPMLAVAVEPEQSVAPVEPAAPAAPVEPLAPVAPIAPLAPAVPAAPVAPSDPLVPAAPVAPLDPLAPAVPAVPAESVEPAVPALAMETACVPAVPAVPATPSSMTTTTPTATTGTTSTYTQVTASSQDYSTTLPCVDTAATALPAEAVYVPKTAHDNSPYRFDMNQNGKRMTADEFDAWMRAKGIRVARGPASGHRSATEGTSAANPVTPGPDTRPTPPESEEE